MDEQRQGKELIKELQDLIAEELGEKPQGATFRPITAGLGLLSPRKPEISTPLPPLTQDTIRAPLFEGSPKHSSMQIPTRPLPKNPMERHFTPPPPPPRMEKPQVPSGRRFEPVITKPPTMPVSRLETAISTPVVSAPVTPVKSETFQNSEVTGASRFFAFVVDQVFVWTVFLFAVVVTLRSMTGEGVFALPNSGNFQNPVFLRFVIIEFATIWIAYLMMGIGMLDMTFGMWVWGLRLRYLGKEKDLLLLKRAIRVVVSFLFFAPILPSFALVIRRRGRNLLDLLSGSGLYRSVV